MRLQLAGFIRKVYGILSAQLGLTILVAGLFMYTSSIKEFVQTRLLMIYIHF